MSEILSQIKLWSKLVGRLNSQRCRPIIFVRVVLIIAASGRILLRITITSHDVDSIELELPLNLFDSFHGASDMIDHLSFYFFIKLEPILPQNLLRPINSLYAYHIVVILLIKLALPCDSQVRLNILEVILVRQVELYGGAAARFFRNHCRSSSGLQGTLTHQLPITVLINADSRFDLALPRVRIDVDDAFLGRNWI